VLAQTAVDDKSNEITAIPELLCMLCLTGCLVTLDRVPSGWGCQKAIARQIRKQGANYVLRLRANHKDLHNRLEDTFALERAGNFAGCPHDYADTVGKDHGRIEIRRCWTTGDPALLAHVDPDREWCDLVSRVWVECERRCGDRVTTDVRIFIASLPPKAEPRLQAVRQHWSIENAHHWVLDVAFGEDDRRIRTGHAAHNMAILKRIAHARTSIQGGHRQQAPGGGLEQGLPVPTDRPQAQTHLDAIALGRDPVVRQVCYNRV